MKRTIVALTLLAGISVCAAAEPLSKIGIVNISRIVQAYYAESRAWREIEEETRKYEAYIAEKTALLNTYRERKLAAENGGDNATALKMDEEIFKLQQHIQEYRTIKYNQIKQKRDQLLQSPDFAAELRKGINYVAENEGFTLIFNSDDRDIMWWSTEVDITDKVLAYLRAYGGSASR